MWRRWGVILLYYVASIFLYLYLLGLVVSTQINLLIKLQKNVIYQYVELLFPYIFLFLIFYLILILLKVGRIERRIYMLVYLAYLSLLLLVSGV